MFYLVSINTTFIGLTQQCRPKLNNIYQNNGCFFPFENVGKARSGESVDRARALLTREACIGTFLILVLYKSSNQNNI